MITIKDVAERCNVSIATVSNVINQNGKASEETTRLVQAAIKELNYTPNRVSKSNRLQKYRKIGVIMEELTTIFSMEMLNGITIASSESGFHIQLVNLQLNQFITPNFDYGTFQNSDKFQNIFRPALKELMDSDICGIIYVGAHPRNVSHIFPQMELPVSYVFCYTTSQDYCVNNDDYQGARLAVEHLIAHNHKRIAIVCGPINSIPAHRRLSGYQDALLEHGLTLYPDYILPGDWSVGSGYEAAKRLFSMDIRPSAVFCMNDIMAVGIYRYMAEHGFSIPDALSIAGFDGTFVLDYTIPPLCSVRTPFREMGYQSFLSILRQLNHLPKNEKEISAEHSNSILLPCSFIEGGSVGILCHTDSISS